MTQALTAVDQREVTFYDDVLTAVRTESGRVYVSVRHMCAALDLAQRGQVLRIKRHKILAEGYEGGIVMITPGGRQRVGMLRVDLVPLWLSGLDLSRVKEEIRPKLERYQREAAVALWEAFQEGRLTADPAFDELLETDSQAAQAYKTFQALTKLARNQLLLEGQMADHERRLEQIEATLGDTDRHITEDQASQLSQAVKAVAMALSRQTGRNEYGGVYGELYRKFAITSYKLMPAGRFQEAMSFLTQWHQDLVGESPF